MFRKTVDSVLSALHRAVKDLDVVVELQAGEALAASVEVERQQALRDAAVAEGARAARVRTRLLELIS